VPNHRHRTNLVGLLAAVAFLLLVSGCTVNVKKSANGDDKNVDINTPVGGIHVSNDVDVRDTGLAVYPGARLREKPDNGDQKQANVNISTGFFGLKVVALEYESDDPPGKLTSYYKTQLKKYGDVLECHTHEHGGHAEVKESGHDADPKLTCEDNSGETLELKAGTKDNYRMVAIEPAGSGTHFSLVRILVRGKDTI
jgi:hypothetical protein